eukprot:3675408-Alexandrium_andersonii.AAC.1
MARALFCHCTTHTRAHACSLHECATRATLFIRRQKEDKKSKRGDEHAHARTHARTHAHTHKHTRTHTQAVAHDDAQKAGP